jgi:hypothetical protein
VSNPKQKHAAPHKLFQAFVMVSKETDKIKQNKDLFIRVCLAETRFERVK